MFHLSQEIPKLKQSTIIKNCNMLANALGEGFDQLNAEGVCLGLCVNYLLFSHEGQDQTHEKVGEGPETLDEESEKEKESEKEEVEDELSKRRDEFYDYLVYIGSLTEKRIYSLVNRYRQSQREGKELYIEIGGRSIQFRRLIEFLKVVNDAHKAQRFKVIGANWDRNYTIFSHQNKLADELNKARIFEGGLMAITTGDHMFALEKTDEGYYLFEPNNIERKLLKTVEDVSDAIIKNLAPDLVNSNVGLNISFLSYGDKNRELDDLISAYEAVIEEIDSSQRAPILKPLITEYHEGKICRADLAVALMDAIPPDLKGEKLNEFKEALDSYITMTGVKDEKKSIDSRLKTNQDYIKCTSYRGSFTNLFRATGG